MKVNLSWLGLPLLVLVIIFGVEYPKFFKHQKNMVILKQEQNLNYLSQDSSSIQLYYLIDNDTIKLNIKK